VLLCQTRALSACSFEIPGSADLARGPRPQPRFGHAVIDRIERLTADVATLHLRMEPALDFTAGQFAVLRVPGIGGFRAYSMVNHAGMAEAVEFVIKKKPGGQFSEWLFAKAAPGDRVEWFGPLGKATFQPAEQRTLLAIAGGSGIASIMSILAGGCAAGHFSHFDGAVFFGVRTAADVFYLDRLSDFATAFPDGLKITVVLSHDTPGEELRRRHPALAFESGFPHEIAARDLAGRFAGRVAYLAGPPILVDVSIRMLITQARLPARDIRYDKFS
jgi:toluene monooxygenase electron transfer component